MGNEHSRTRRGGRKPKRPLRRMASVSADPEGSYLLISNENAEVFEYDPKQTFMLAYGIDKQTNPRFSHRTLTAITVLDAHQVCMALIDKKAVPKENVQLFQASKDTDLCTFEGMKERFLDQARQVGKEGLFIFHFSGHGLKVGNEWGLAPADFDYTDATFLTGSLLNHWLHEADCKARHIFFTLDCCFAGGLAEELTSRDIELRPGLYVLSACTAFETSLVIGPLGHSIFAYFLAYALRVLRYPPGKLPILHIFEECGALCVALSSLLISYNPAFGLKFGTMQPQLKYFDISTSISSWVEESVKATPVEAPSYHPTLGRYAFVLKYYRDKGVQQYVLCELCLKWLESISDYGSPLSQLYKRGLLKDEILRAATCSVMWSMVSIQMVKDRKTIIDPNMFLVGFLHVAAAFDYFKGVELTLQHLKEGWEFYQAVVETNKLDDSELQQLYREILQDLNVVKKQESVMSADSPLELEYSGDFTDSIVMKTIQAQRLQEYLTSSGVSTCTEVEPTQDNAAVFKSIVASWWVPLSHTDEKCAITS